MCDGFIPSAFRQGKSDVDYVRIVINPIRRIDGKVCAELRTLDKPKNDLIQWVWYDPENDADRKRALGELHWLAKERGYSIVAGVAVGEW